MTNSFAQYGMCVAMRGVEGGGLVEGLPAHNFYTDEGDVALKCPTEVPITDRREKELADLGFVPLVHCKGTDYAAFFSVQTCQKPKLYDTDAANANARLSTQLPYIMAVSRFAHYLKAMMRDKIGSFMSREEAEVFLNRWITQVRDPRRHRLAGDQGTASAAGSAHRSQPKCRASRAATGPWRSCGRTSSWMSLRFLCGWLRSCRHRPSKGFPQVRAALSARPSIGPDNRVCAERRYCNGSQCIPKSRWPSWRQHQQAGLH